MPNISFSIKNGANRKLAKTAVMPLGEEILTFDLADGELPLSDDANQNAFIQIAHCFPDFVVQLEQR